MRRSVISRFQNLECIPISQLSRFLDGSSGMVDIAIRDDLPIHMRWLDRGFDQTLVTFSAAITRRAASEVPVFSGWSMSKEVDANLLMISDPSLLADNRLNLGWYLGSINQPYLTQSLYRILRIFSNRSKLTLFGGSGGGFASLLFASKLPGARAVVSNPQTDVRRYMYFDSYAKIAWHGRSSLMKHLPVDLAPIYSIPLSAEVVYIQNAQDRHHMDHHFAPFMENLNAENRVLSVTPCLGHGHVGPTAEDLAKVLQVVASRQDWGRLVEAVGMMEFEVRT